MPIDPNQPQMVSAIVGFGGAILGALVGGLVQMLMLGRRIKADERLADKRASADLALAERKFDFDERLAEHKVELDAALAKEKFAFDKALIAWRRQYELAEQVLSAAYEARDALSYARVRLIRAGEGKTRVATEAESDQVREARDSAFVPVERLAANLKAFATLQTLQDPIRAHFGSEAVRPISEILAVHHGITTAAALLIQHAEWNEDRDARRSLQPFDDALWGNGAREAAEKLGVAVIQLEEICKPILAGQAPT